MTYEAPSWTLDDAIDLVEVEGSGGGGKSGGGSGGKESPNTLKSKAVARLVYLLGEGVIKGLVNGDQGVIINKVPFRNPDNSANYKGLQYVMKTGTSDQEAMPGFDLVATEYSVNMRVKQATPVTYRTESAFLDAVIPTVNIPSLTKLDDENGDLKGSKVQIAIDIRSLANVNNTWVRKVTDTISGKNTSPYERSYRIQLSGEGPWLVRMTRITPDSDDDAKLADETYFSHITEVTDYKISYADSAVAGVEIDSEELGNSADIRFDIDGKLVRYPSNYNPVTRAYTGFWDGTWSIGWCDNPAWAFMDVCTNPRYGVGIPDILIDKWGLYTIAKFCDEMVPDGEGGMEPRFRFNGTFYQSTDAYKVLQQIASMMRAIVFYAAGAVIVRHDAPMSPEQRIYTPANVVGEFSYSGTAKSVRHNACTVQWINPELGYEDDFVVYEERDNIIKYGYNNISLRAIGTQSRGQAYRQAKWTVLTNLLQTDTVTFEAGRDSNTVLPGDIIEVADPHWATADFGGRIVQPETKNLIAVGYTPSAINGAVLGAQREYGPWGKHSLARFTANVGANEPQLTPTNGTATNGVTYTSSVTVLQGAGRYVKFTLGGPVVTTAMYAKFDLQSRKVHHKGSDILRAWIQDEGDGRLRLCMRWTAIGTGALSHRIGPTNNVPSTAAYIADGTEALYAGAWQQEVGSPTFVVPTLPKANGTTQFYLDREIEWDGATAPSLHMTLLNSNTVDDIANVNNTGRPIKREIRYFTSNIVSYHKESNMVTLQTAVPAVGNDNVTPLVWIFSKAQLSPRPYKVISNEETEDKTHTITALNYSAEKFSRMDEGFIINYGKGEYSNLPAFLAVAPPLSLRVEYSLIQNGTSTTRKFLLSWPASTTPGVRGYRITYVKDNDNPVSLPDTSYTSLEMLAELGNYEIGVSAIGPNGNLSAPVKQGILITEATANGQVVTGGIVTGDGTTVYKDRNLRAVWVARPLSYSTQKTVSIRVARSYMNAGSNNRGEIEVQGGVGSVSDANASINNTNRAAPVITITGTWKPGDQLEVKIGDNVFITRNEIGPLEGEGSIAAGVLSDLNNWSDNGAAVTADGSYYALTDNAGSFEYRAATLTPLVAGTKYTTLIRVKKDAVPKTTRFAIVRFSDGGNFVDVNLDTSTGEYMLRDQAGANVTDTAQGGVADDNDAWIVWMAQTMVNTSLGLQIYPAVGAGTTLGAYNAATQGSISVNGLRQFATPVAGNLTSAQMAAKVAAKVDADARYTAVAASNVVTLGFVDGANVGQKLNGNSDQLFRRYRVEVRDPNSPYTLKRVAYTTEERYTYVYEDNQADFPPVGTRSIRLAVQAEDIYGNLSIADIVNVSNPAPTPTTVGAIAMGGAINLIFAVPTDPDYAGIEVHMSETSGFTPNSGTLVYDGNGTPTIPAQPNKTYYIKYRFYDYFGKDGISYLSMTVNTADILINGANLSTTLTQVVADTATALARLASISSNSVLDRSEKGEVVQSFNQLTAEKTGINSQATSYGLTTLNNAYNSAYTTLSNYLTGLSPAYNDLNTDTNINRATWDSNWNTFLNARTAVLQGTADAAATMANWTGVNGRPANLAGLTGTEGILNTLITMNADGSLSGAGGGAVTLAALAPNVDPYATQNGGGIDELVDDLFGTRWTKGTGTAQITPTATSGYAVGLANKALEITPSNSTARSASYNTLIRVFPNQNYYFSARVSRGTTFGSGTTVVLTGDWFAADGTTVVGTSPEKFVTTSDLVAGATPKEFRWAGKAPTNAVYYKPRFYTMGAPSSSPGTVRIEGPRVVAGFQILDQMGLPVINAMGLRYKFTGVISYSATAGSPATATISVTAGQALIGSTAVSYNAMSVGVSGTGGTSVGYYLYIDDPGYDGGAATLFATTSTTVPYEANGRMFIGSVQVTYPSSGSGGGGGDAGGGSNCVDADANVITLQGNKAARDVVPGDLIKVTALDMGDTEYVLVTDNHVAEEEIYLLRSESGIDLRVSHSTPLTMRDGKSIFPIDLCGQELPVEDENGFRYERCWSYRLVKGKVAHIYCGSRVYAAGYNGRYIYTHNPLVQKP